MHSVDLLEEALALAADSGFEVRQEWLNEQGGGACRIGQQWVLFVDLSLSASEQLEQVLSGLIKSKQCRQQDSTSPDLVARLHAAAPNGT